MNHMAEQVRQCLLLALQELTRKPARTLFTMLGVVIAFLLFGLLQGVDSAYDVALARLKLDRLFVDPRFSQPLPLAYRDNIAKVPSVRHITPISFMGGYYQDPKNQILVIATTPSIWLGLRPEYSIEQAQIRAMEGTRNGAIVTGWLAKQEGWEIGDQFTIRSRTGAPDSRDWEFKVVGIMEYVDPNQQLTLFLANFAYYDEGRSSGRGTANRFLVGIDDPLHSARTCRQIDQLFAFSGVQTRTQTEQEMGQFQVSSLGGITSFTRYIVSAVFMTLIILTGNTMIESINERTREFGVLKALGFSNAYVVGLVLCESMLLCVIASLAGLGIATIVFPWAEDYVEIVALPAIVYVYGMFLGTLVALMSALIPMRRVLRLRVCDALAAR